MDCGLFVIFFHYLLFLIWFRFAATIDSMFPHFLQFFLLLNDKMLAWLFWLFFVAMYCYCLHRPNCYHDIIVSHYCIQVQEKTIVIWMLCFSRFYYSWQNVKVLNAFAFKMILKTNNAYERRKQPKWIQIETVETYYSGLSRAKFVEKEIVV